MNYKIIIKDSVGEYGITYLQTKILTEINKIRIISEKKDFFKYDIIYVSNRLSNIITDASYFTPHLFSHREDDTKIPVGYIKDMNVFIDFELNNNIIKLSSNLSKIRNYKISSLLDDMPNYDDVIIEIESDLI